MRYIRVAWRHDHPDEPVQLLSELDDRSWEVRKVEVFRGGALGRADAACATGGTRLGLEPVPDLEEINRLDEFSGEEISREEFETAWAAASSAPSPWAANAP